MRNLIKKILKESDEWDWVRDSNPWISFEEAKEDQFYNVEMDEILLDVLMSCASSTAIYYEAVKAQVMSKEYVQYSDVYCGSENDDEVLSLHLMFYNENGYGINSFWVTEDMITLYPILDDINESTENPLQWIIDEPIGITLQPNTLYYFKPHLTLDEIKAFANGINNSEYIKNFLLRTVLERVYQKGPNGGLKYFVTGDNVNDRTNGWCTATDIEYAKIMYPRITSVDGRIEFGL